MSHWIGNKQSRPLLHHHLWELYYGKTMVSENSGIEPRSFLTDYMSVRGEGQGGLACFDSWGRKEWDMTERLI